MTDSAPPPGDLLDYVQALVQCTHAGSVVDVGERFAWCKRCGALRAPLERAGGDLASEPFFVPSGVRHMGALVSAAFGHTELTPAARALLDWIFVGGPQSADECARRFGSSALLDLALRNLIDIDEQGAVLARGDTPAPYDSQIRLAVAAQSGKD